MSPGVRVRSLLSAPPRGSPGASGLLDLAPELIVRNPFAALELRVGLCKDRPQRARAAAELILPLGPTA
jgi:hypothetical protein